MADLFDRVAFVRQAKLFPMSVPVVLTRKWGKMCLISDCLRLKLMIMVNTYGWIYCNTAVSTEIKVHLNEQVISYLKLAAVLADNYALEAKDSRC